MHGCVCLLLCALRANLHLFVPQDDGAAADATLGGAMQPHPMDTKAAGELQNQVIAAQMAMNGLMLPQKYRGQLGAWILCAHIAPASRLEMFGRSCP